MFKSISMLAVAACAGMSVVSCTADKNFYDPSVVEQNTKAEYEANFIKKFGTINPDQSWDMSANLVTFIAGDGMASRMAGDVAVTCVPDASYPYYNADGWFDIPYEMQAKMNVYKEREDHSGHGLAYAMSIPENNFTIIPLHQGYSNKTYEVHMVVGSGDNATDYLLWKKGEMLQKLPKGSTRWENLRDQVNSYSYGDGVNVRAKAITFKNMPTNQPMYFYVSRPTAQPDPLYPSSLDGFMMDITNNIGVPPVLAQDGKKVRVIGIEAQYPTPKDVVDWDYEDIMFAIVGDPNVPEDIPEIEKLKFKQVINKRYMIEDLGDTDDYDFNDIVVDVRSTRTLSFEKNSATGEITNRVYGDWAEQTATIQHLGGTLNFNLKIGNTVLGEMEGKMNVDPKTVHEINGWNPDANNISIEVKQKEGESTNSIGFPQNGNVPMIIATNTDKAWMAERHSILDTLKELILGFFGE
ncbi:MAG: hypothetical protein MJZ73_11210 [Bacteroidaceae bacterium]|nr:hypothetical protein [Bacteroidaceae bacterium]